MKLVKILLLSLGLMSGMAYADTCEYLVKTEPELAVNVCLKEIKQQPKNHQLQLYLGASYYQLDDYTNAIKWYTKSANLGNVNAQNNLGTMYAEGQGVAQDYQKSIKWFLKSANQGFKVAQSNLGKMYENGNGV